VCLWAASRKPKKRSCSLLKTVEVLQMTSEAVLTADHARLNETPKSNPAPDGDGRRYCRHCRELRAISAFPAGPRRYVCKAHLYERFTLPAKRRVQADEKRRVLSKLWALVLRRLHAAEQIPRPSTRLTSNSPRARLRGSLSTRVSASTSRSPSCPQTQAACSLVTTSPWLSTRPAVISYRPTGKAVRACISRRWRPGVRRTRSTSSALQSSLA
jgi:hypothetical protein